MNIRWWQGGIHIDPGFLSDDKSEKETYLEDLQLLHHVFAFLVDISTGRIKVKLPPGGWEYEREPLPDK